MDFSSIPAYFDPSNWQQTPPPQQQQQQQNHHGSSNIHPNNSNPLLPPPPLPPPLQAAAHGQPPQTGPMGGSIRPGSMAERARMANIPMPEAALKCPRCDSTNTKFCYFNNYSLSQPRHFCKTCRRYWTRGGALRSVPVGGGCRRNKRSKSASSGGGGGGASSSKSAASDRSSSAAAATSSASSALSGGMAGTSSMADILGLTPPPPLSALRFLSPLHHVADYGSGGLGMSSYGGIPAAGDLGFQLGSIGGSSVISGGMDQPWRIPAPSPPQFPFLGGLDAAAGSSNLYGHPFDGVELSSLAIGHVRSKGMETAAAVKMEGSAGAGSRQEMSANLATQFNLGNFNQHGNAGAGDHFNWGGSIGGGGIGSGGGGGSSSSGGGNAWTDMSGLNNSSCSTTSAL